jgi:hypothetical protein
MDVILRALTVAGMCLPGRRLAVGLYVNNIIYPVILYRRSKPFCDIAHILQNVFIKFESFANITVGLVEFFAISQIYFFHFAKFTQQFFLFTLL